MNRYYIKHKVNEMGQEHWSVRTINKDIFILAFKTYAQAKRFLKLIDGPNAYGRFSVD